MSSPIDPETERVELPDAGAPDETETGASVESDAISPIETWHDKHRSGLTLGQRAADRMRNGMGSWTFIAIFLAFMAAWAILNMTVQAWDPYPFILLNLFLSMLAGMQGAILLIAAKRQDAIAAALARHDYETNLAAKREIEELMRINHRQLEMLAELRGLLGERDPSRKHSEGE